ncbi:MAG TPA: hypothetical protein DEQ73_02205 [Phycisphaerales bacterium]|nr:hypothetical protein [Phycisphaerales bacterium]
MSAVGFIGPSNPASNLLVRYGVVKVQPALWLPTIVDRMAEDVGSVLLVRSELSKPCAFLSGDFSEVPVGASLEELAAVPATRRLLIPAAAASAPAWPTLVVTGLGPNLAESLAALQKSAGASGIEVIAVVGEPETAEAKRELQRALPVGVQPKQILWVPMIDGLHQPWEEVELDSNLDGMALTEHFHDAVDGEHVLSVDDLLRGDPVLTSAPVSEPAPVLRGPGVRIAAPVGQKKPAEKHIPAEASAASSTKSGSGSATTFDADRHHSPGSNSSATHAGFEHLQPCSWKVPGGSGRVIRDSHGEDWGVVLEHPTSHLLLAELKVLHAFRDSGLPSVLGLGESDPTLHVVVSPEGLAEIPSGPGIKRWCCIEGRLHPVAD